MRLYTQLASVQWRRSSFNKAEAACIAGLALVASLPPSSGVLREEMALTQRATIAHYRGNYAEATTILNEWLPLARQIGDQPRSLRCSMPRVAPTSISATRRGPARFQESLEISSDLGDVVGHVAALNGLWPGVSGTL